MKFFKKETLSNNRVHVFVCGIKILSCNKYSKNKLKQKVVLFDDNGECEIFYKKQLPKNIVLHGGGRNNVVKINKGCISRKIDILFDDNASDCHVVLEDSCGCTGLEMSVVFQAGIGSRLMIGKNTVINGAKIWLGNGSVLSIGNNCMLSYEIVIRTTDGHTILDNVTNAVVNHQKRPCIIGDNCWIGLRTIINKNARLPNNTIVASGSVLTRAFKEEYTVLAGNPAVVIKSGVRFVEDSIYMFEKKCGVQ